MANYEFPLSSAFVESGDDVYGKPLDSDFSAINWQPDQVDGAEEQNTNVYLLTLDDTKAYVFYLNVSEKTFTVDSPSDVITCTAHGLLDGEVVRFKGLDLPAGLSQSTIYYVRDRTTDTFKVSATAGGAVINITDPGSGTMTLNSPSLRSINDQKIKVVAALVSPAMTAEGQESLANTIIQTVDVDGYDLNEALRLALSALAGKVTATSTSFAARAVNDSKTRITAATTSDGDRTAITLDAS